jgi:hypothetical protein
MRSCTTEDGAAIEERILKHSDDERFYEYEIIASPMPVRSYRSRLTVLSDGTGSRVVWDAEFEPEAAEQEAELSETFAGIYREGLEALRARLAAAART